MMDRSGGKKVGKEKIAQDFVCNRHDRCYNIKYCIMEKCSIQ